jgi:hypothetical protein
LCACGKIVYFFAVMPTFVRLRQDRLFLCRDANRRAPAAR